MASSAPVTVADLNARVEPIETRLRVVEDQQLTWRAQQRLLAIFIAPAPLWALWQMVSTVASAMQK